MQGYRPYFKEAFGTEEITKERVAQAIADYERTRVSGNSPYDRWRFNREQYAVSAAAKRGHDLFFDTAGCVQCHTGSSFSDSLFHNLGVGWDPQTKTFSGRRAIRGHEEARGPRRVQDAGAARRQQACALHARRLDRHAARGGGAVQQGRHPEPESDQGRIKPLGLKDEDVDAIVAFLESLDGEGYQDTPPDAVSAVRQ